MPLIRFNQSLIANGAITTPKIADDAVTADKIASGAIIATKIADDAVTADKIASAAITTNKIAAGAVTADKLANTLDLSSKTITLPDGVGSINWTGSTIQISNFTATNGIGYYVDTTSASITVTLPALPSIGNFVGLVDVSGTSGTNRIIIDPNGSNFQGGSFQYDLNSNRAGVLLVYSGSTQGWIAVNSANETSTKILV